MKFLKSLLGEKDNQTFVGLDIGGFYIKLGVFENNKGLRVTEFARFPDEPAKLTSLLSVWVSKHHLEGKPTFSSVSDPGINIQHLSFPGVREKELPSAVRMEAEQILGKNISMMDSDFSFLSQKRKTERLLFVAIPQTLSEKRVALLNSAGLKPAGLTLDILALTNGYLSARNGNNGSEPMLLLNIGHHASNLAIVQEKEIFFIRDIFWGVEKIAAEIVHTTNFDTPGALDILEKRKYSLIPWQRIIDKTAAVLVNELVETIIHFQKTSGIRVENLVVTGGGSQILSLPEYLAERLFLKLKPYQALKNHNHCQEQKRLDPFCAVLAGLFAEAEATA